MKTKSLWLAASLVLNVVLATLYLQSRLGGVGVSDASDGSSSGASVVTVEESAHSRQISEADLAAMRMSLPDAMRMRQEWGNLDTADLKHLIAQLRERGLPEPLIRRILDQLVREKFQVGAHHARYNLENPYWKDVWGSDAVRKDIDAARASQRFLKELFGAEAEATENESDPVSMALSTLPPAKYNRVQTILADYEDMISDLRMGAMVNGLQVFTPEELEKLQFLERQRREDLQRELSSSELEDYLMRRSTGADLLRRALAGFQPSESEFKNIFRVMEQRVAMKGGPVGDPSRDYQLYNSTLRELQQELTSVLGPERAAQYALATEPQTASLTRLLTRLELPMERAKEITSLQAQTMSTVMQVRANSALSAQDKQAQLAALQTETRQKITGILGERGIEAYQQNMGRWLSQITSTTNRTVPPPPR
ncbi:MAG TPA: hypothetical protein PLN52_17095 [Opitutaceae bacterium]|nr:hypothetical protein [Opitutaceae bacterium]